MFLDVLRKRNPDFLSAVASLHQQHELPANSYVLDIEAVGRNAARIAREAARLGLDVFAMTKQVGRHPDFAAALVANGIHSSVAVDMECARATAAAGLRVGNIGHLVQVPAAEAGAAAALGPANWTVFSIEKAREAAAAALAQGRTQALLLRVHGEGDTFYPGHEGGFSLAQLPEVIATLQELPGVRVAGVTTFPALLFDEASGDVRLTPNVGTLQRAAELLRSSGIEDVRVNAPGTTSAAVLPLLAEAGATQVEPGHSLTGTTPLHVRGDLPEEPAAAYLTEVSHHHDGRAYFFGGGLYIDPVFAAYQPTALIFPLGGGDPMLAPARLPLPSAIDYYGQLDLEGTLDVRREAAAAQVPVGSTVIMAFRFQAFVTRAYVVSVHAVSSGGRVGRVCSAAGSASAWPA